MTFSEDCQVSAGVSLQVDDEDKSEVTSLATGFLNNGVDLFNHPVTFGVRNSVISTPTTGVNIISLILTSCMGGRGGSQTWTQKITEGGVTIGSEITSTFNTISRDRFLISMEQDTNVAAGATTYDLETKSSGASQIALRVTGASAVVISG